MTMIKWKSRYMLDEIEHLKEFAELQPDQFVKSWHDVRIVERSIQIIAQTILDISGHIIANKGLGSPQTYREILTTLSDHDILEVELAKRLANLAGMRNILVHEYQEIDRMMLFASISLIIDDGPEFVSQILKLQV